MSRRFIETRDITTPLLESPFANCLPVFLERGCFKCSQTKVDLTPGEINEITFMYLVEIGLAGNTQSTCFGSTGKVHRKTVVLDRVKQTDTSKERMFKIQIEQLFDISGYSFKSYVGSYFY